MFIYPYQDTTIPTNIILNFLTTINIIISILIIMTIVYNKKWIGIRIASLLAYCLFVLLYNNLIVYNSIKDIQLLII